jgi:hypothetical protein
MIATCVRIMVVFPLSGATFVADEASGTSIADLGSSQASTEAAFETVEAEAPCWGNAGLER